MRKLIIFFVCLALFLGVGGCTYMVHKNTPQLEQIGTTESGQPAYAPPRQYNRNDHSFMTWWMWYHWMNASSNRVYNRTIYVPTTSTRSYDYSKNYPDNVAPPAWDEESVDSDFEDDSYGNDSFDWDTEEDDSYYNDSFDWDDSDDSYYDDSFDGWDSWDNDDSYYNDSFSDWDDGYDSWDSGYDSYDSYDSWDSGDSYMDDSFDW